MQQARQDEKDEWISNEAVDLERDLPDLITDVFSERTCCWLPALNTEKAQDLFEKMKYEICLIQAEVNWKKHIQQMKDERLDIELAYKEAKGWL